MTLANRPRVRRLVERAAYRALRSVAPAPPALSTTEQELSPPEPAEPEAAAPDPPVAEPPRASVPEAADFVRELRPAGLALERRAVSSLLFERLDEQDVANVERALAEEPELQSHYQSAPHEWRAFLVLAYGIWLEVDRVSEKTGLQAAQPPEEVHAMARGALAAAGGIYEADLVVDALESAGVEIGEIASALDLGSSSGRVVRALAAAYPEIAWQACDPNGPAIEWARDHLPGIEFFVSHNDPPLALEDGSLDLVYAISIWSHFEPQLGLRWFEEMRRVLRPGGYLVCTTHGPTSVDYYASREQRTPEQSREIADALYGSGAWYAPEFGEEGDWGVVNPDWGTAFFTPEWLLTQLCPRWRVLEFAPGRNQENQDVYVLQRV